MVIDVSNVGNDTSVPTTQHKVTKGVRHNRCAPPSRFTPVTTATFKFVVTYNSGQQKVLAVTANSAQAAINILRDGCIGLCRFQYCGQQGTQYPY